MWQRQRVSKGSTLTVLLPQRIEMFQIRSAILTHPQLNFISDQKLRKLRKRVYNLASHFIHICKWNTNQTPPEAHPHTFKAQYNSTSI